MGAQRNTCHQPIRHLKPQPPLKKRCHPERSEGSQTEHPPKSQPSVCSWNETVYRETPVVGASTAARSARPGRGNRGPTFVASFVTLLFGRAHDVAHQRDAYFGISHIFTHPPRAF